MKLPAELSYIYAMLSRFVLADQDHRYIVSVAFL
jgi:hypothetical protein